MSDRLTPEQRHLCMSRIHSKGTRIEIVVRKRLHADGFRFRLNVNDLPGKPDIVLPKYRTAIFVNGCFWHGHKNCKHSQLPQTNIDFWVKKIEQNRLRDDEKYRQLEALQWNVLIVWECELKKGLFEETVSKLEIEIKENGLRWEKNLADRKKNRIDYQARCRQARERKKKEKKDLEVF